MQALRAVLIPIACVAISAPVKAETVGGTGFFITVSGYLVTNHHVVSEAKSIKVRDARGRVLPATAVAADSTNDLVILKVDGVFDALPIISSRSVRPGAKVITMGFPHVDIQGTEPKVTEGIVSSVTGSGNDPRVFQISNPVQAGNSGGPLVNADGAVVGVVTAKIDAVSVLKATGDLPQNVNYATKSNYLLELISTLSDLEQHLLKPSRTAPGSTEQVAAVLAKAIVLVIAEVPDRNRVASQSSGAYASNKPAELPNLWLSLKTGNQFSLRLLPDRIQGVMVRQGAGTCRISSRLELIKSGSQYAGTQYIAIACPPGWATCRFENDISVSTLTPTRVEGTIVDSVGEFDTVTCRIIRQGRRSEGFVWIPQ